MIHSTIFIIEYNNSVSFNYYNIIFGKDIETQIKTTNLQYHYDF